MRWFRLRTLWWPTWPTWLLLAVVCAGALRFAAPRLYDFLSPCEPSDSDILVVEGWLPDYAVPDVLRIIESHRGLWAFTTGGAVERGSYLREWKTYAEMARATLLAAGVPTQRVVAVPAPATRTDRTFSSALALSDHLKALGIHRGRVSLVTFSAHARRSRSLFQRALGPGFIVASQPYHSPSFGRNDWWTSSEGFRFVIGEAIALLHMWVCPPRRPSETTVLDQTGAQVLPHHTTSRQSWDLGGQASSEECGATRTVGGPPPSPARSRGTEYPFETSVPSRLCPQRPSPVALSPAASAGAIHKMQLDLLRFESQRMAILTAHSPPNTQRGRLKHLRPHSCPFLLMLPGTMFTPLARIQDASVEHLCPP